MNNYPKTYEECCEILGTIPDEIEANIALKYKTNALKQLQRVILCRDAYIKLATLDDIKSGKERYIIKAIDSRLVKETTSDASFILSFPAANIRDTFYDNFHHDILKIHTLFT